MTHLADCGKKGEKRGKRMNDYIETRHLKNYIGKYYITWYGTIACDIYDNGLIVENVMVRNNSSDIYFQFGNMPLYSVVRLYDNYETPNYICKYFGNKLPKMLEKYNKHSSNYVDAMEGI